MTATNFCIDFELSRDHEAMKKHAAMTMGREQGAGGRGKRQLAEGREIS